ncbi:hypothetical protein K402DRAFT_390655 [Aulographum hederae CBS 113979]|uniref:SWI5-dependent HO expression protein 3 n=1 Tax=Aulographum hederae CBS 113979 TaxID=1176131 RepID=A0A6G1H9K2_9PEZI|nr:hypothetical protein K402DRAFT_390655 [Aulographum hederae CBS 113979]
MAATAAHAAPKELPNISSFRATLTSQPPTPPHPSEPAPEGRSGRAIQKLTADNDRLRRDLNHEKAAREESARELAASKAIIESLRSQLSNLTHDRDTNQLLVDRKERRIADMRTSLTTETGRREQAERKAREMATLLDNTVSNANKEVAEAKELAKFEQSNSVSLRDGLQSMKDHVAAVRREFTALQKKQEQRLAKVQRDMSALENVCELKGQEAEKTSDTVASMKQLLEDYKKRDAATDKINTEMQETVDKMKWVIALHTARQQKGDSG